MSDQSLNPLTKEQLLSEVNLLEGRAFSIMGDSTKQTEYHSIMNRVDDLTRIARERKWI